MAVEFGESAAGHLQRMGADHAVSELVLSGTGPPAAVRVGHGHGLDVREEVAESDIDRHVPAVEGIQLDLAREVGVLASIAAGERRVVVENEVLIANGVHHQRRGGHCQEAGRLAAQPLKCWCQALSGIANRAPAAHPKVFFGWPSYQTDVLPRPNSTYVSSS